jgi:hypothetical protein
MSRPLLDDGSLGSPYLICVRAGGALPDAEILQLFGLLDYERVEPTRPLRRQAVLADAGGWTVLADDWYYTLWHMPGTRPTIASLGTFWDVFAASVGDSDRSFDFEYYRGGRLVRRHVVVDPHYRGGEVAEDDGAPLPGETAALLAADEWQKVLGVARAIGVPTAYNERDVRVYAPRR